MNFAEQLVYWYLRLNGFFPLTNFVLHHGAGHRASDTDLLAVRFPHVSEDIGGSSTDWDEKFQDNWNIDLTTEVVGLIAEVKSGGWNADDLIDPDREWRVQDGLKRLEMIASGQLEEAMTELRHGPITHTGGVSSAKLFVGDGQMPDGIPWLHLQLSDADQFVRRRMQTYDRSHWQHRRRCNRRGWTPRPAACGLDPACPKSSHRQEQHVHSPLDILHLIDVGPIAFGLHIIAMDELQ